MPSEYSRHTDEKGRLVIRSTPYNNTSRDPDTEVTMTLEDVRMQLIEAKRTIVSLRRSASWLADLLAYELIVDLELTDDDRELEVEEIHECIGRAKYLEDRMYDSNKQLVRLATSFRFTTIDRLEDR